MGSKKFDPVLLEVMRNALQSVAEEMTESLVRTAYSTNIKDRRDCSSAVYNKRGDLVVQAENIPLHLGLMPTVVKAILKRCPVDELKEGDGILINDPYISGSHLPDVTLMSPVFHNGEVVALVANMAHHVDVGGMSPGSMSTTATEIFQEGIRFPPVKILKQGRLDNELLEILKANTRTPHETEGDLRAQIAANNVGVRRIKELIKKYGLETTVLYMDEIMNYSERRMRKGIEELGNGKCSFVDYLEGDGITDKKIRIKASLEIKNDEIIVDFTGTDPQVEGPMNCTRGVTLACVYFAVKAVVDPEVPSNAGANRPITAITPKGTLVNPNFPAAVAHANINTAQRIVDVILGAFSKIAPERVTAASSGTMSIFTIGGFDPRRNSYYSYVETYGGGQGAMYDQDGMDGVHNNMTNTRNAPVEAIESSYPLLVEKYGLVPGSGGAGKYRGGVGMTREIRILGERAYITIGTDRQKIKPWGLFGGLPGGGSRCFIVSSKGEVEELPTKVTRQVKRGDKIVLITPGGGGFGPPKERDPSLIRKDILEGLVSEEEAKEIYGFHGT